MFDRPQRNSFRAPEITQRNIRATVKWFNATKGFGFVTPEDGSPDAFLHSTVLQFCGHDSLPEGATITCDLSRGPKGPQVATIHDVDTSTASESPRPAARAPRSDSYGGGYGGGGSYGGGAGGAEETVDGTVKWFNVSKGFGFIAPSTGGKDIFVHIRALERSGLDVLADGEQVRVTVRQGVKGPEAQRVEVV
ncbi:cold-shock protein (plasmid) [Azospirillum argentinense]|uniref:Cold-shock protein n=1 Tax=Azospirillum argentinense TaxID=2970906 RepID=A0A060DKU8_9PROT|nr:cold shock domain-containing protein [Azospirillum argentinense]AIB14601.1 cold-shock protein [Azospirillum argentinense]EZQ05217.1 cold-shock protein [Azospirillum argentinense]MBK3803509.1 cold-shock protein [Azospirillum argentinense]PNQ99227.1 cold-shock protein [Azospirillum argentinense]